MHTNRWLCSLAIAVAIFFTKNKNKIDENIFVSADARMHHCYVEASPVGYTPAKVLGEVGDEAGVRRDGMGPLATLLFKMWSNTHRLSNT